LQRFIAFFSCFLHIALFIVFSASAAHAQSNQFSGTFSLPGGVTAPSGGTRFEVRTEPIDEFTFNSQVAYSSTQVNLLAGQSSSNYSIRLDNSPQVLNKTVRFVCLSGCANLDITTSGWWSASAGVVGQADASSFAANTDRTINLQLEPADIFAGSIVLPEDFTTTGAEQFIVEVVEASFAITARFTQTIEPSANLQQINFRLGVPSNETGGGWNLSMRCINCANDLEAGPYFAKSISGVPVSLKSVGQFFFRKNADYQNMRLDLISLHKSDVNPAAVLGAVSLLLLSD
jgi:hypothetical protein